RLLAQTNGEHCLDDAKAQNHLQKCLTFSYSGSSPYQGRGSANPPDKGD
ncbi:MAG: hypothetical protein US18_C0026G0001, partial [Parcubacteria group bacterium GW2011_GWB1_36_5]